MQFLITLLLSAHPVVRIVARWGVTMEDQKSIKKKKKPNALVLSNTHQCVNAIFYPLLNVITPIFSLDSHSSSTLNYSMEEDYFRDVGMARNKFKLG